jgi:hypothetical protein
MSGVIDVQYSNMTNAIQYLQSPNFFNPDPQYRYYGPYAMGSSCSWVLQVTSIALYCHVAFIILCS